MFTRASWRRRDLSRFTWMVLVLAMTGNAEAWGDRGHEIVCEIAYQSLGATARKEVERLMKLDASTFAVGCTWPDHPKQRRPEHFINLPRSWPYIGTDQCHVSKRCLFTGIETARLTLSSNGESDAAKLRELKFLGHWIGDLHQPLHVSFRDDQGGNEIGVVGACEGQFHSAWDTCLVEKSVGEKSVKDVASTLLAEANAAERAAWTESGMVAWADESFKLTISTPVGYCSRRGKGCWYEDDNEVLDDDENERTYEIDGAYVAAHRATIRRRLLQAGVRLAAELEELLGH